MFPRIMTVRKPNKTYQYLGLKLLDVPEIGNVTRRRALSLDAHRLADHQVLVVFIGLTYRHDAGKHHPSYARCSCPGNRPCVGQERSGRQLIFITTIVYTHC